VDTEYEQNAVRELSELSNKVYGCIEKLNKKLAEAKRNIDIAENALFFKDEIIPAMNEMRIYVDNMETMTGEKHWPYPTYGELLFKI